MSPRRLVFVEDDETFRRVMTRELTKCGFDVRAFPSAEGVPEEVAALEPELCVLDLKLPGKSGLELLRELRAAAPELQVVILTGHGSVPEAVQAMREGAYDFLTKPASLEVLEQALLRAGEKHDLLVENRRLRRVAAGQDDPLAMLGESEPMTHLRHLLERIAPTDNHVLIQGENGTGKELIARNLHRLSRRSDRPFVVVNCAAIPESLVASELFGHERGAFTGAEKKRSGLYDAAHEGTLFLDEIGELPLSVQPALLRAVQFGEIRPVGSDRTRSVDVRVVAATNRDLLEEVAKGGFREDLYYRLAALRIEAPALRERPEDIAVLARTFLERAAQRTARRLTWDEGALRFLATREWPGNIRELENVVTRISVLATDEVITADAVKELAMDEGGGRSRGGLPTLRLEDLEKQAIAQALERHGGDKRAAAEALGIALRTLYNKVDAYGLK